MYRIFINIDKLIDTFARTNFSDLLWSV